MIEILSIGDRVPAGKYRPFFRFAGALNFVRAPHRPGLGGPTLVCVIEESKGAGPLNIVVRGDLSAVMSLEVRKSQVLLGGSPFKIERRYDSALSLTRPVSPEALGNNLAAFEVALLKNAPAGSLAFLLKRETDETPPASYMAELARTLREGFERLLAGDMSGGARAIKGRGFGLTPGGDDLLAGFLLGLNALHAAFGLDVSKEVRTLRRASRSRNLFSEAFLRCAAEGRFFESAKVLASALFQGSDEEVRRACARLSAVGASSGADLSVGLLSALKLHASKLQKVSA
ncbi:MAG: DUF2877 domain-containing protein [candidate division NC10 bacterium]